MPGGSKTCELCGGTYNAGTDLSKYGCACLVAKMTAAKANREACEHKQPTAPPADANLGSPVQCEDCWGFYNSGVNKAQFGCPCAKAQGAAVAAARSAPKVELMYFDGAGRAELARLALNAGGLSFTDKRVAFAEWPAIKADPESLPSQFFGSMPLLTVNGESVAQSTAIAMLAADLSLHKSLTPMQRAKCVMFQGVHADLQAAMYKCLFGSDESKKAGADALPGSAANLLKGVENQLPASGFVNGGDAPTLADLALFDVVSSPFPGLKALKVDLSPYPKLNALMTAVAEFGPLKPYLEKRGF